MTLLLNVKCKHIKLRESFVDYWGRVNREQSDKVMKDAKAVFGEKGEEEEERGNPKTLTAAHCMRVRVDGWCQLLSLFVRRSKDMEVVWIFWI